MCKIEHIEARCCMIWLDFYVGLNLMFLMLVVLFHRAEGRLGLEGLKLPRPLLLLGMRLQKKLLQ